MRFGLLKVTLAEIDLAIAKPLENAKRHIEQIKLAYADGSRLIVFTELSLTGYTCADLFLTHELLSESRKAILKLLKATNELDIVVVCGAPLSINGTIYNCAVVIHRGRLIGIVPKCYLPDYGEYYESRYFTSGLDVPPHTQFTLHGQTVPFGSKLIFACENMSGFTFAVEICEDLWVPLSPSDYHAIAGANIICNPSASNDYAGKATRRERLIAAQSEKLMCAYLYSSGGTGESSTDLYFSSDKVVSMLGTAERYTTPQVTKILDLQSITASRRKTNTFKTHTSHDYDYVTFTLDKFELALSPSSKTPFLPTADKVPAFLNKVFDIQTQGLVQRMRAARIDRLVIGVSGGLDSTLALLVCVNACKELGLPTTNVHALTMPCFGTTTHSFNKSISLINSLGCTCREIDIKDIVTKQLNLIDHDGDADVTYENAQARQRMMMLMNVANDVGGLVVGTSDLSEIAIGFSTFGGDHLSMYNVNCSIPKTLVRELVRRYGDNCGDERLASTLHDIASSPISPELLPVNALGEQEQDTESIVGSYELIDFLLYHQLKFGFSKVKLTAMLKATFVDDYDEEELENTAKMYFHRFYRSQFKRSCMPDGIKAMELSLSPRSDYRLPSDM